MKPKFVKCDLKGPLEYLHAYLFTFENINIYQHCVYLTYRDEVMERPKTQISPPATY